MNAADIRRIFKKSKRDRKRKKAVHLVVRGKARAAVRAKTGGKCHVCGGTLGDRWQADHVVPLNQGGRSKANNFLPVCTQCNRLRWGYKPAVLRLIMRFGIFAKQEIRRGSDLGDELIKLFEIASRRSTSAVTKKAVKRT
jgi:5-methylcytosine-specific restriction endonuclease McrA